MSKKVIVIGLSKRSYTLHSLDPRFNDTCVQGKDVKIESLFQHCVSGSGARSVNDIKMELAEKIVEFNRVSADTEEDEDINDAKRRQLRQAIKKLTEEVAKAGESTSKDPFPFEKERNSGHFSRKIGQEVLESLQHSYESLCSTSKAQIAEGARNHLIKAAKAAISLSAQLWTILCKGYKPDEQCWSQQVADYAGIQSPLAPSVLLPHLLDPNASPLVKKVIAAFVVSNTSKRIYSFF